VRSKKSQKETNRRIANELASRYLTPYLPEFTETEFLEFREDKNGDLSLPPNFPSELEKRWEL
jgi:hypothetical protein